MSPGFLKLILSKKKHFAHMVLIERHCFEGENLLLLLLLDSSVNYLLPKVKKDCGDMEMKLVEKRYEPLDHS